MSEWITLVVGLPFLAALFIGVCGSRLGPLWTHRVTIGCTGLSSVGAALIVMEFFAFAGAPSVVEGVWWHWLSAGLSEGRSWSMGYLLDRWSVMMIGVVTSVSLAVQIYSIGYMRGDKGYVRFFAYLNLFTAFMLLLVVAPNFLQLLMGWEGVGLLSYLLIGFWYTKEGAIQANLKAFIVNRVADLGLVLGIAMVFGASALTQDLNFATLLKSLGGLRHGWMNELSLMALLLFIGAMGKSAQVPLHGWLPDSMEGPTPISALIHAATMVTAGIFLVVRLSPLYQGLPEIQSILLFIGTTTMLLMGLLGCVQQDIKRVIAYSTLSQLGYMVMALGSGAPHLALFHLMTHAFFKALLFLGAGRVILAMHHEQAIFEMGGLRRALPKTFWCMTLASASLIGLPGFSGFFSKELIIQQLAHEELRWAWYAAVCGVFITAFYTGRLMWVVFYGAGKHEPVAEAHSEAASYLMGPLWGLLPPAVGLGFCLWPYFSGEKMASIGHFLVEGLWNPAVWAALAGLLSSFWVYRLRPEGAKGLVEQFDLIYCILKEKYGIDELYRWIGVKMPQAVGDFLNRIFEHTIIDRGIVQGTAREVRAMGISITRSQTGLLYDYLLSVLVSMALLLVVVWGIGYV